MPVVKTTTLTFRVGAPEDAAPSPWLFFPLRPSLFYSFSSFFLGRDSGILGKVCFSVAWANLLKRFICTVRQFRVIGCAAQAEGAEGGGQQTNISTGKSPDA